MSMDGMDDGRSPAEAGSGHSDEPASGLAANAGSVPNAADIPPGWYCYASISPMDERGRMQIKGMCPFWERRPDEHAYCRYLDYETECGRELLWDQVKICGVNGDDFV